MNTPTPTNCERCNDPFSMYAKTYPGGLTTPGYAVMREKLYECNECAYKDSNKGPCGGCGCQDWKEVDSTDHYICYKCASADEQKHMRETGAATLYLSYDSACNNPQHTSSGTNITASDYKVGDWSEFLSIRPTRVAKSRTFIPKVGYKPRYDVWFVWENYVWHGTQFGDNTQLLHCKRAKLPLTK